MIELQVLVGITVAALCLAVGLQVSDWLEVAQLRKERVEHFRKGRANRTESEFLKEARQHEYEEWIKKPQTKPRGLTLELTPEQQASWDGVFELFKEGKL